MCVPHLYGVPAYKGLQRFGQVACLWQARVVGQYGYNTNVAGQCGRDLDGDEVIWVIDPADAAVVSCFQPIPSDDG
jgi:hypothetical protein